MIKISHRLKTFHFKCLVVHKEIKTQKMIQKMNAYKIRRLFMINKAFKSLKLHMRYNQSPIHPQALHYIN